MQFEFNNKTVTLNGLVPRDNSVVNSQGVMKGKCWQKQGMILHVLIGVEVPQESMCPEVVKQFLQGYSMFFKEPTDLPPIKGHEHQIILKDSSKPISVRPYHYRFYHKSEIEKIVAELLGSGLLRNSQSPYSSPVLFVTKADGIWRICIDYRALNYETIKDKYPIPVIDELLDELSEARDFSKLDLRFGYHQIRMKEEDIPKTALKTHRGHYEFLIMPFSLTNALATIQGLMNEVFRPFLRKFVLVFFYGILVYSKSVCEHVNHLDMILKVLQQNQLFTKMSKCKFACEEIEYLGHLISKVAVRADLAKLEAMQNWDFPDTITSLRGF